MKITSSENKTSFQSNIILVSNGTAPAKNLAKEFARECGCKIPGELEICGINGWLIPDLSVATGKMIDLIQSEVKKAKYGSKRFERARKMLRQFVEIIKDSPETNTKTYK